MPQLQKESKYLTTQQITAQHENNMTTGHF